MELEFVARMKDHIIFQLRGEIIQLKNNIYQLQVEIAEKNATVCALQSALLEHRHCPIILEHKRDVQMAPYMAFLEPVSSASQIAPPQNFDIRSTSTASGLPEVGDSPIKDTNASDKRNSQENDLDVDKESDSPRNGLKAMEERCHPENNVNIFGEHDGYDNYPTVFEESDRSENIKLTCSKNNCYLKDEAQREAKDTYHYLSKESKYVKEAGHEENVMEQINTRNKIPRIEEEEETSTRKLMTLVDVGGYKVAPVNFEENTRSADLQSKSKECELLLKEEGDNVEITSVNFEDDFVDELQSRAKENKTTISMVDNNNEIPSVSENARDAGLQSKSMESELLPTVNVDNGVSSEDLVGTTHSLESQSKTRELDNDNTCKRSDNDSKELDPSSKDNCDLLSANFSTTLTVDKAHHSTLNSSSKLIVDTSRLSPKGCVVLPETVFEKDEVVQAGNLDSYLKLCRQPKGSGRLQTKQKNQKNKATIQCEKCDGIYSSRRQLLKHELKMHFNNVLKCFFCKFKSKRMASLVSHISKCRSLKNKSALFKRRGEKIPCSLCDAVFNDQLDIIKHSTTHLKSLSIPKATIPFDAPYKCPVCDEKFVDQGRIKEHLDISHKEGSGSFECKTCSERIESVEKLCHHIETLHVERDTFSKTKLTLQDPYSCPVCDEKFISLRDILQHFESYENSKPFFRCKICSLKMLTVSKLFKHIEDQHVVRGLSEENTVMRFKCRHCDLAFNMLYLLEQHLKIHEIGEEACNIGECNKTFKGLNRLKRHKEKVHFGKLKCDDCDRCFKTPYLLRSHRDLMHEEKKLQCEHCSAMFSRVYSLQRHIENVHTVERPFKCTKCDRSFKGRSQLQMHDENVHGAKTFQCSKCAKTYSTLRLMKQHEAWHSNIKPSKCPSCPKSFKNATLLYAHKYAVHVNVRKFSCDQCGDRFKAKHHLKAHMLKHSRALDFICDYCGKAFMRKQILDTHILSHTGERPFSCSRCSKSFIRKTDLNKHMREKHKTEGKK